MAVRYSAPVLVGLSLVMLAVVLGTGGVTASDMVTIDADHDLTTTDQRDSYDSHGVATAEVAYPAVALTVAE